MTKVSGIDNMELKVTPALYKKKEKVWLVHFNNRQFTLYKLNDEWMQGTDDDYQMNNWHPLVVLSTN